MATKDIKSIQKCFEILSAFTTPQSSCLNVTQIGQITNIPLSTLYRYLQTLTVQAALNYDSQSNQFSLGPLMIKLGTIAAKDIDIQLIAKPLMQKLRDEVQETVYLTGLVGQEAICIEKIDCKNSVRYIIERGDIFPVHASATGRVLMAFLSTEEQEKIIAQGLKRFTEHTITDPVELRKSLQEIRERGYALSSQELGQGGMAISAPIFNSQNKIFAGLSIAAPVDRFRKKNLLQFNELLIQYANKISGLIGYNPESSRKINSNQKS
ncbi:MAG: IclR family transcriptional regulator [Deltaproteobacteria bacterium]|nr:IclR family transcriptional regulator [Deltaproteobacteria bacterium]